MKGSGVWDVSGISETQADVKLPEEGLRVAGFALAHAAWSTSDLKKGEALVPLAVTVRDGRLSGIQRFEAATQAEAIQNGKAAMKAVGEMTEAWAFARDGILHDDPDDWDAITVDFWARGMGAPASVVQRYEPFATNGHFRILGDALLIIGGQRLKPPQAKRHLEMVLEGVQQHQAAAPLWAKWQ
jgi:hypothetical protein